MRKGTAVLLVVVLAIAVGIGVVVWRAVNKPRPGCIVSGDRDITLSIEQAENAATIAGVGYAEGLPDHAVTVALATALQESRLQNLPDGDRDSAGLFQQRPSQGWGTYAQVTDPVYAATAFYRKLREQPDWQDISVTQAAQVVQRSAAPQAYAQWEPQARAMAMALTGESPAALRCRDVPLTVPGADVATVAANELGTTKLSGPQPQQRGWAIASWLVAHAARLGLDSVTYDGRTWTADSGQWETTGPADGTLSLQRATSADQ
ncbi:hypothetical protein ACFQ34_10985 [Pseudonocardia benzenivorans]|uniref:ARB-07466-like C-terminal domain-containing protein n=1 Tax=Pseudonocardia benzenivorans TaxID=228005 RepID=A0ABW3VG41_9PSEU